MAIDAAARSDALAALGLPAGWRRGAPFLDAGPERLSEIVKRLIFVDGPSPAPGVVSVASTREAWAAAVMGSSGACYWLRYSAQTGPRTAPTEACTGHAALSAADPSW